jgi:isocitrate/isopropylmalate dehydrogenase
MHQIAVIPGDGIGPEVIMEGLKVLDAASQVTGFQYKAHHFDFGGDR